MIAIYLDELSQDDREHLHAELVTLILAEMSYPPYLDYHAGVLRMRPPTHEVRQHASTFVTGLTLDHIDITTSAFTRYIADILLRYQNTVIPARRDLQRRCLPAHLIAPALAKQLQQRLLAVVMQQDRDHFGLPSESISWKKNLNAAPLAVPWESMVVSTVALAHSLAVLRDEALPQAPQLIVATVSDMATTVIPIIDRVPTLPEPSSYLPTAPLPQPVPTPPKARNDRVIFLQLREQLMQAMLVAGRSYGLPVTPDDPAGLLGRLRQHGSIDVGDLRLAEGILALCGRIITEERADIDDYRQAMTLYLLFHRGRFGHH